MQASNIELDARFAALTTQRDQAANQVVMLAGNLAEMTAKHDALAQELAGLHAKIAEEQDAKKAAAKAK